MATNLFTPVSEHTIISDLTGICVFDLETTGTDVFVDRIVTAYLGRINRNGEVTGSYNWLVNPGVEIAQGAIDVHGITDEIAQRDGQDAATAVSEILGVLQRSVAAGRPTVAYNASFDLSMLNAEAVRYGFEPLDFPIVFDPLIIDKGIDKYRKGSRKLIDTAKVYGVAFEEEAAHDAEADAVATGRVAWAVLDKVAQYTLRELHDLQIDWAASQAASFQEYLRRTKDPEAIIDGTWPMRRAGTAA